MYLTGAEIIIECLREQGTEIVFGYPGGTIVNVYDAFYRRGEGIRHVLTAHEQGAAHAADGYARATGRTGVCMATSGPGATNLVTGIATAYMDSVPMVAITVNVAVGALGKDSFQEVDIAGITMPITKHNFIVKEIAVLADTLRRAFKIASSGRKGPVLVDITKDVTVTKTEYEPICRASKPSQADEQERDFYAGANIQYGKPFRTYFQEDIPSDGITKAVRMLKLAKRPVVLVGGGALEASAEIMELAGKLDAPVTDTLMGKGICPGNSHRYLGMLGMHGTKSANAAVSRCDLLLAVGTRFSDRTTGNGRLFAPDAQIIHIDIDSAEINKNIPCALAICGDVSKVLQGINKRFRKSSQREEWMSESGAGEQFPSGRDMEESLAWDIGSTNGKVSLHGSTGKNCTEEQALSGPYIVRCLSELTRGEAVITTEVGQNQMWTAQNYSFVRPRQLITSGGLGTMGYGLGAAIGAKLGRPEERVINIAGDGCFRMNFNELATVAALKLSIIEVVFHNNTLGMVHQWQDLFYNGRFSQTMLADNVDYVKLAEAFGINACRITRREEVVPILREALNADTPMVIDCLLPETDNVWPMMIPGSGIADLMTEEEYRSTKMTDHV